MKDTILKRTVGKYTYHIFKELDEDADLSFLGEYSNTPAAVHIDREERGDMGRHEYRYFNAGCGDPDYIEQDYKRYEDYNRGGWCMMGAVCEVSIKTKSNWAVDPIVARASLWGIESDSGEDYFRQVAEELITEAKHDLKNLKAALCGK